MLNDSSVAVVIPALNEERTINQVVSSIVKLGYQPFVIDDGSKDLTAKVAKNAGAIILTHKYNKGYESSLSTGIHEVSELGYKLAATFDADGQLFPNDLTKFVSILDSGEFDLVVGVRDYRNRYTEYLLALIGRFRFGISDPLCGIKLYRLNKAKIHFPFDSMKLVGMELAFKMIDAGYNVCEQPVRVRRRDGESRYGSSFLGEWNIFKSFLIVLIKFGLYNRKKTSL